jgi:uncharacterized protein (TIGR02001 family)
MKKVVLSVVAALALSAAPAFAADMPVKAAPAAPAAAPSPWDIAFGSALMSDYVFRGITQSNHKPSVAAYFEPRYNITKDIQLYVGVSGESISFSNRAAAEIDLYGGARWTIGPVVLDGGFWYYYYPGGTCYADGVICPDTLPNNNFIKANMSFWEVYFKPTWNVNDSLAIGGNLFYTPSMMNSGAPGLYVSGTAKYTLPANMLPNGLGAYISGEFGHQYLGTTDSFYGVAGFPNGIDYADYNTWNIGIGFTKSVFTLDLRYSGTDLSQANCNAFTGDNTAVINGSFSPINPSGVGSKWCGDTFIAKLAVDLTASANLK